MNFGSGVNVTSPDSGSIVYVPSFGTLIVVLSVGFPVSGSTNFAGFSVSISTVFSIPLTVVLPGVKFGVAFCGAPWITSVFFYSPVGVTGNTLGV